jgi:hypothetical protein
MSPTTGCRLEVYADSPEARAELVRWLVATEGREVTEQWWQSRLKHWWDDNPWSALTSERGWVLRHEGRLVGFQGLIPAAYAVGGERRAAAISSTWRVDPHHRNHSLPMLMQLRKLGGTTLLADTTPTAEVQVMLKKTGWQACPQATQWFVIPKWLREEPLGAGRRITHDLNDVRRVLLPYTSTQTVEKWITPEYLRWYAASVTRKHHFVGVVDADGCLSSYLFLVPSSYRSWTEVDHFTVHRGGELQAMVSSLREPYWVKIHSFPADQNWYATRSIYRRKITVCHHFLMPKSMQSLQKRTTLAEGDWGL